jgi:hypothetical protein
MKSFHSTNALHRRIPERIIDCVGRIDELKIRSHVESFCKIGPRCDDFPSSIHRTVAYLKQTLDHYGYEVEEERSDSEYQTNVIVELPGTISKNRVFEIGAHYDTKPNTPGADDNASGLAGLLEIARAMAVASGRWKECQLKEKYMARQVAGRVAGLIERLEHRRKM